MKLVKLPNGEYILQKSKSARSSPFLFWVKHKSPYEGIIILSRFVSVPKELIGKKLILKATIHNDTRNKPNLD